MVSTWILISAIPIQLWVEPLRFDFCSRDHYIRDVLHELEDSEAESVDLRLRLIL